MIIQAQREREKEGEEFRDKEEFVTEAYKKKLVEIRETEALEKLEEEENGLCVNPTHLS